MAYFLVPNPKITHRDMNIRDYLNSSELNQLEFVLTKTNNSPFTIHHDIGNKHLFIEGGLLKYPVCSKPKFSWFASFYEINKLDVIFNVQKFDIDDLNKGRALNGRTRSPNDNQFLWGKIYFKFGAIYKDHLVIEIMNSNENYIKYLFDLITTSKFELWFSILFQKIGPLGADLSYFPIIDLNVNQISSPATGVVPGWDLYKISENLTIDGFPNNNNKILF